MPEPPRAATGGARWRQVVQFWTPGILLSPPVFAVSLVLTAVGNLSVANDLTRIPERLAVVIVVHVFLFAVIWCATIVVPRAYTGPRGWLVLAGTLLIAAIARAVLLATLFDLFAVGEPLLGQRIVYSLANPTALVLVLTALWGAFGDHAATSRHLAQVRERLSESEETVEGAETALSPGNLSALRRSLRAALDPLTEASIDPRTAAAVLRMAIDTVVRPVTRTLSLATAAAAADRPAAPPTALLRPRFSLRDSALDALDLRAAWPVAVAVFALVLGLPAAIDALGPLKGTVDTVASVLMAMGVLLLGRGAALRWPGRWSRYLHLPASALAAFAAYALPLVALGNTVAPTPLGISTLFYVSCGYLLALAHSAFSRAAVARAELAADNDRLAHQLARRRAEVHIRQSSVARALHGTVQARLTAAYLRLQLALNSGAATEIDAALHGARDDALEAVDSVREGSIDRRAVDEIVTELNDTWDDLAGIWLIAPLARVDRAGADPLASAVLTELLPELVFNAIKHSDAASIAVDLDWPDDESLRVVLYYDHRESSQPSTPSGLGDRTLDEVCLRWSRQLDGDRGRTEIVLPWSALG